MILKQSLILSPHLGPHAAHNLLAPIAVRLPAPRLAPDDILRVTPSEHAAHILIDLDDKLSAMAQNQHPDPVRLLKQTQRLKICKLLRLMFLDRFENQLLSAP